METVTMSALLKAEEEKTRSALRADDVIDRNRKQSADRLDELLGKNLLQYNAAYTGSRDRQAIADALIASVQDMLPLLTAGTAVREIQKRRFRTGALVVLLLSVICALVSVLLIRDYFPVSCAFLVLAAVCGFLAGLLWYGEREVRVHAGLDPEIVWKTLLKTTETMDRKTEEFLAQEKAPDGSSGKDTAASSDLSDPETLQLLGSLLEAYCSGNGEFALRQLRQLEPWLLSRGIECREFSPETAELFDLLPTKARPATLRPALLADGKLLLTGKATEQI